MRTPLKQPSTTMAGCIAVSVLLFAYISACDVAEEEVGLPFFSECDSSLCERNSICEYELCRPLCTTDTECESIVSGSVCVKIPGLDTGVCIAPDEVGCESFEDCPGAAVCVEGNCRTACNEGTDCLVGWVCGSYSCTPR